jgi:NTE family protein
MDAADPLVAGLAYQSASGSGWECVVAGQTVTCTYPAGLVDGGVVNPLPLDQADIDTDFLIGIDVNGDPSEGIAKTDHKALDIWFGSAQIMMHSLTAHMMAAYPPDIYIRPHVTSFGALEFWRVREIVAHGEAEKERFKRILADKIEAWSADRIPVLESNP